MRKRLLSIIPIIAVLIFSLPVYADGKTQAEIIQEALLSGEETPDVETTQKKTDNPQDDEQTEEELTEAEKLLREDSDLNISGYDPSIPADQIEGRITNLDPKEPDETEVRSLRASFDKLSSADKLKISNISELEKAEITLEEIKRKESGGDDIFSSESKIPAENEKEVSSSQTKGTEYTFEIDEDNPSLTVIMRFTTDDNHDGKGDVPDVTLTAPDLSTTLITRQATKLEDKTMSMYCTWTTNFLQVDMERMMEGKWTINTSVPVTFSRSDYLGAKATIAPTVDESDIMPEESQTTFFKRYGEIIKLSVTILLLVGGFIGFMIFSKIYFGVDKKNKPKKVKVDKSSKPKKIPGIKKKQKEEAVEESNVIKKKSDEEIIEEIKREFEAKKEKEREMDELAREENDWEEDSDELSANRAAETQRDYDEYEDGYDDDEEDMNEDFSEHVGDTDVLAEKAPSEKKKKTQFGGRFS